MEKQQIIDLIKQNSQMNYEEMKTQATEAGVPLDMFEEAWGDASGKKKSKVWKIIAIIILGISLVAGLYLYLHLQKFNVERERIEYNSGLKTIEDCIEIGKREIPKLMDDYRLHNIVYRGAYSNADLNKSTICGVYYLGNNGKTYTYINIGTESIQIQKALRLAVGEEDIEVDIFNQLSASPAIMSFKDFYAKIKENPGFKESLELALESKPGTSEKDVVTSKDIIFEEGRYVWHIFVKTPDIYTLYSFDAITGEYISERET